MKLSRHLLILALSLLALATIAHGQENPARPDFSRRDVPPPDRGDIPPDLKRQLTADQQAQLKAASSMSERIALLKQWNISLPKPPDGAGPRMPPPEGMDPNLAPPPGRGPMGDDVASLSARYEKATSDQDREMIRDRMRQLFRISKSDEEKQQIRDFFKRYPDSAMNVSGSAELKSRPGAGVVQ